MRKGDSGKDYQKRRIVRAGMGGILTAAGVFVAVSQPAGSLVALFLVGVGCGMIDPSLVSRTFKSIVPKPEKEPEENP